MGKKVEMAGQRFGRLTVVREVGRSVHRQTIWHCVCDCGREKDILGNALRNGHTRSCGCMQVDAINHSRPVRDRKPETWRGNESEYRIWSQMRNRCQSPSNPSYPYYGGRGITVAPRWESYDAFLADVGLRPSMAHTLDRIDNSGNYEPGNVRWATKLEQANNTRTNVWIDTPDGEKMTIAMAARKYGLNPTLLVSRRFRNPDISTAELFGPRRVTRLTPAHSRQTAKAGAA